MPRRVIIFGLSANPPTGMSGHAGIVQFAATRADEVWVLPVYRHAFHEKRDLAPYEDRLAMAKLAFEHLPGLEGRVHVKETEREVFSALGPHQRDHKIGTIDVVRKLIADHPDTAFTLLLGADTYRDLASGRWKESEALEQLVPVLAVAREGVELEPRPGAEIEHVPGLDDVSSSRVRASTDPELLGRVLQPEVLEHIRRRGLYAFARA